MPKNFTTKSILLIIILAGFVLNSCYEEPILEPVKRPYSSIRVGNFSYNKAGFVGNIDQFNVYVDNQLKGAVNVNQFSDYFDLVSGSRHFVLTNGADTLYKGDININSYEEMSIVFSGVYAPAVDTLMSFAPYSITEGVVYLYEAPSAGNANILATNVAPNTDTENQINYSLSFVSATFDTTLRNLYDYNTSAGLQAPAGDYTVWVLKDISPPLAIQPEYDTLASFVGTFAAGMKENLFITGDPSSPIVVKNQHTPLAVRPK